MSQSSLDGGRHLGVKNELLQDRGRHVRWRKDGRMSVNKNT